MQLHLLISRGHSRKKMEKEEAGLKPHRQFLMFMSKCGRLLSCLGLGLNWSYVGNSLFLSIFPSFIVEDYHIHNVLFPRIL